MLKPASLYRNQLSHLHVNAWYDIDNKYFFSSNCPSDMLLDDMTNRYSFVSVDNLNNVVGYMDFIIDNTSSAVGIRIIAYKKKSLTFARDIRLLTCNMFFVYNVQRISWMVCTDNPVIKSHRLFIKNHGGRECGTYRRAAKLLDNKLHDVAFFEILREEFVYEDYDQLIKSSDNI